MSVKSNPPGKNYNNTSLLAFGIGFVILGILLAVIPEKFTTTRMSSPGFIRVAGVASALFFGVCTFVVARQILKNENIDSTNER